MISRGHGLALSLLLGAAAAVGAWAVMTTAELGAGETKPELVSSREIAAQARKLDAWQASLAKTLHARPPALPPLRRFAPVALVEAPVPAALPRPIPVTRPSAATASRVEPRRPRARPAARPQGASSAAAPSRPVVDPSREREERDDETAPSAPSTVAAAAPSPPSVATPPPAPAATAPQAGAQPPATLSVERQCEALKQAAEGKGEQAKQAAERQCEALKQAAERR